MSNSMKSKSDLKVYFGLIFLFLEMYLLFSGVISHLDEIYISGWPNYSETMDHSLKLIDLFYSDPIKDMYYILFVAPISVLNEKSIEQEPTLIDLPYKEEILMTHPEILLFNSTEFNQSSAKLLRFSDYNILYILYDGFFSFLFSNDVVKINICFLIAIFFLAFSSYLLMYNESKSVFLSIVISNSFVISNYIFFNFTMSDENLITVFPTVFFLFFLEKIRRNPGKSRWYIFSAIAFSLQFLVSTQLSLILLYLILFREILLLPKKYSILRIIRWKKLLIPFMIFFLLSFPQILISYANMLLLENSPLNDYDYFVSSIRGASFTSASDLFSFYSPQSLSLSTWILTFFMIIFSIANKRWQYPVLISLITLFCFGFADWNIPYLLFSKLPLFSAFRVTKRFVVFIPLFNFAELVNIMEEKKSGKPFVMERFFSSKYIIILFLLFLIFDIVYCINSPYIGQDVFFDPYI